MAITNGYCTRAELKARLGMGESYTAATISFASATKIITDTAQGFANFLTGDLIVITGSTSNNGTFTITAGGLNGTITVSEALTNENAGASVTIAKKDTVDDTKLDSVAEAISRVVDEVTGTRFFTTANDETRYYTPQTEDVIWPDDDIISITTLATDEDLSREWSTTWATTDYDLLPFNATLDSKPYREIEITPNGAYSFEAGSPKYVKIVGKFGYCSTTPTRIKEACLLAAERLFKRKDAIFGVVGSAELGVLKQIMREDPDVQELLDGYKRLV